jgi:hypothetical protein
LQWHKNEYAPKKQVPLLDFFAATLLYFSETKLFCGEIARRDDSGKKKKRR